MSEPVGVRVRDCECPGAPHGEEGDIVFLAPTASLTLGLEAQADIVAALGNGTMLRNRWLETFVRHGAVGWNWLDADGPRAFDVEVILADYALALPVAEKADELYGDTVTAPLVRRLNVISRRGPTAALTSPSNGSTPKPHRRSSPSTTAASRRSRA